MNQYKSASIPFRILLVFLPSIFTLSIIFDFVTDNVIYAANIVVTNNHDSGTGSLRQAINDSVSGDTILFDASLVGQTITLTSGTLSINNENLTISGPGANNLTINGNLTSRVFNINSNTSATLSGLTITGGYTALFKGGGISNSGTLTLEDVVVRNNVTASRFSIFYLFHVT